MKTAYETLKKLLFVLAILLCSTCFYAMHVSANDNEMTFHSIYVGSGDALVVESKGHYMIVDSGPPSASKLVTNYISKLNIPDNKIDYVVATHPDGDHVGNFNKIFEKYEVGQVFYSPCVKGNKTYSKFINSVKEKGCPYRNPIDGESWKLGDATVTVVYDGFQGTTYNECSIVLRVTCGGKSLLLTGDLPSTMEKQLLAKGYNFKADVLKVGHHGAGSSSCTAFIKAVQPQYAIISSSRASTARLPRASVLKRLALQFVKVYRTTDKDVVFNFIDGKISTPNKESIKYTCIKNGTIALSSKVFRSKGKAITPSVSLVVNGKVVFPSEYKIKYSSNKNPGVAKVKLTGLDKKFVGTCTTTFMILPKKETIKTKTVKLNKIKLGWEGQKNVTGYYLKYSTSKSFKKNVKYKIFNNEKNLNTTIKGLSFNKKYYFSVRAFKSNIGDGKWSKTISLKTEKLPIPTKGFFTEIIEKTKSIKLQWKKQSSKYDAGYMIQYSPDKKFKDDVETVTIKKVSKNSFKLKKKPKTKDYYIRVKGYNKYCDGKWSKVKKVKFAD